MEVPFHHTFHRAAKIAQSLSQGVENSVVTNTPQKAECARILVVSKNSTGDIFVAGKARLGV